MRQIGVLLFLLWGAVVSAEQASFSDQARQLWHQDYFQVPAAKVLALATDAHFYPDQPVVILYESGKISFSADGTETRQGFMVYRIQKSEAVDGWGQVKVSWSPWHEERPQIHGQVINPDGSVWPLDTSSLVELQNTADDSVYSDSKTLQAPYPHVGPGSIIEEEVTTVSHPLLPGAGVADQWQFGGETPVLAVDLSLQAPLTTPFTWQALGTPLPQVQSLVRGQLREWTVKQGPLPGVVISEENLPREAHPYPSLAFSTAPSWGDLATAYAKQIQKTIQNSTVTVPPGNTKTLPQAAATFMQWINAKVRYVGLELGQNSLVPYPPQTVLTRGYGDCKDKAVLLTNLLRLAGYPAEVALLWDGSNRDIPPQVPGLDWFDHAIVYVGGPHPVWLDPTSDFSRGTHLPPWDQERWALIASTSTHGLVQTPSSYSDPPTTETRVYHFTDSGNGNITETTVYQGGDELYFRQHYSSTSTDTIKKDLLNYAKVTYDKAELGNYSYSDPHALNQPFTFLVQLNKTGLAVTYDQQADATIHPQYLLNWVPDALTSNDKTPRKFPFRFTTPLNFLWRNQIHLPFGYTLRKFPEDQQLTFGDVILQRHSKWVSPGLVEIDYRLKSRQASLTPAEFMATRDALANPGNAFDPVRVIFDLEAKKLLDQGHYPEAFVLYRQMCDRESHSPIPLLRYSQVLLKAGFGDLAQEAALQAVQRAPQMARTWAWLGWVREFDSIGRRFGPGYDRQGALKAYEKAVALAPQKWEYHSELAILWEYDTQGLRYQNLPDLENALAQYAAFQSVLSEKGFEINPMLDLWTLGRWQDVLQRAATLSDPVEGEAYTLAAIAQLQGIDSALEQVKNTSLDPSHLRTALEKAANLLIRARHYAAAAKFLHQASLGSSHSVDLDYRAELIGKLSPKPILTKALRPEEYLQAFFSAVLLSKGHDLVPFQALITPPMLKIFATSKSPVSLSPEWISFSQLSRNQEWPVINFLDYTSEIHSHFDTIGNVLHDRVTYQGQEAEGWFLKPTPAGLMMTANSMIPESLIEPLEDLTVKKDSVVSLWIKDFLEDLKQQNLYPGFTLSQLWKVTTQDQTTDTFQNAQLLIDALKALLATQPNDVTACAADFLQQKGQVRRELGMALLSGYQRLDQEPQSFNISETLFKEFPGPATQTSYYHQLLWTKQVDVLKKLLTEAWKAQPNSPRAQNDLLEYYLTRPNPSEAEAFIASQNLTLSANQANTLAWDELFMPPPLPPQAQTYALQSVTETQEKKSYNLNTLAAVYAEEGRLDAAHEVFLKSLQVANRQTLLPSDWYVVGLMAEGYGLTDEARRAYLKIPPTSLDPLSVSILAQRRLAKIPNELKAHPGVTKP